MPTTQTIIEIQNIQSCHIQNCYDGYSREGGTEHPISTRLQRLIDSGSMPIPYDLSSKQLSTLGAVFSRLANPALGVDPDCEGAKPVMISGHASRPALPAIDYRLGLDEIDTISRTRAGYAFTELPAELQEAVLSLILTRDLVSRRLDLDLWLQEVHLTTTDKIF